LHVAAADDHPVAHMGPVHKRCRRGDEFSAETEGDGNCRPLAAAACGADMDDLV